MLKKYENQPLVVADWEKHTETRSLEQIRDMVVANLRNDERLYIQRCEDNSRLLSKVSGEIERRKAPASSVEIK